MPYLIKKNLSLPVLLKIFKLEIDRIVVGSRFQSPGAAQLNDLSPKVFVVLTFEDVNKTPES